MISICRGASLAVERCLFAWGFELACFLIFTTKLWSQNVARRVRVPLVDLGQKSALLALFRVLNKVAIGVHLAPFPEINLNMPIWINPAKFSTSNRLIPAFL